jgi:hypothetical protein
MSWSQPIKVFEGTTSVGLNNQVFDAVGSALIPSNRYRDERGLFTIEFDSDPGVSSGVALQEARIFTAEAWAEVFLQNNGTSRPELDLSTLVAPNWNMSYLGFPIYPRTRWRLEDVACANAVNFRAWVRL